MLGYNPLKQIAQPRPVGWISTYGSGGGGDGGGNRVAHIAPYSFFGDVARGDRPMVAYAHVYLRRHLCCSIVATSGSVFTQPISNSLHVRHARSRLRPPLNSTTSTYLKAGERADNAGCFQTTLIGAFRVVCAAVACVLLLRV